MLTCISGFFESNAFKTMGNSSFLKSFSVDFSAKISIFSKIDMVACFLFSISMFARFKQIVEFGESLKQDDR